MFFKKLPNVKHLSDLELIEKYRASENNHYIGELYKRYTHLVYGVCFKYLKNSEESKDASMAIFERLLDDLHKHEIQHFKSWLHVVSKNHCLMQLRKKNPLSFVESIDDTKSYGVELSLSVHHDDEEIISVEGLEEGLKLLNEEQKVCIDCFTFRKDAIRKLPFIQAIRLIRLKVIFKMEKEI